MEIREVMTPNVEYVHSDTTIKQAADKMKELDVGVLPIVAGDRAIGILTDRDIVIRSVAQGLDPEEHQVVEAYSEDIISCREGDDIKSVADLMEEKQVRRVIVTNTEGKMTGIVSLGDLAENIQKEKSGEILEKVSRPSEPER